jgi:hypothetical protein
MRLRDYIVNKSEANAPLGVKNPVLKRIAIRAGISVHTLHSISLERRFASAETAAKIKDACDGHVGIGELTNGNKQKPGPKAGSRARRARDLGKAAVDS